MDECFDSNKSEWRELYDRKTLLCKWPPMSDIYPVIYIDRFLPAICIILPLEIFYKNVFSVTG